MDIYNHNQTEAPVALSLYELNSLVAEAISIGVPGQYWVEAEISEAREVRGHCYLELVEKDDRSNTPVARASAKCWQNRWSIIRPMFERVTGQRLHAGMKVMLRVYANFHEAYGFSWIVSDINPEYTLGDLARRRKEIVERLKADGVFDLQRELLLPMFAQRIAVVSSEGAAGFGDFCRQLHDNAGGYQFDVRLFPAVMQGEAVERSVVEALNAIYEVQEQYDCVVIIRGGGSTSDLNSCDNYDLAANVAQFPLPVICGIGHDRDNTVVDSVASVRVKTPTAAAEWLLDRAQWALDHVNALTDMVVDSATQMLSGARQQLAYFTSGIPLMADNIVVRHRARLQQIAAAIPVVAARRIDGAGKDLAFASQRVAMAARQCVANERQRMTGLEKQVELLSPDRVLRRGYSLTLRDGHVVTSALSLRAGDSLVTRFADGERTSVVE